VAEDLTAGLVVVVAAVSAAAFPTVLMKCFKLVTIAQMLVQHLYSTCTAFVQHLPLIECNVGLKKSRYNIL
jgi:hypothetical protein